MNEYLDESWRDGKLLCKRNGPMFRRGPRFARFREAGTPRAFLTFFFYPRGLRGSRIESARLVFGRILELGPDS